MNRIELVAELLRTADGTMTSHQIADALGCNAAQVKHVVQVLLKRKVIHIFERCPSVKGRNTCKYLYGDGASAPEVPQYTKHSKAVKPVPTTLDRVINRQRKKVEMLGVWGGLL